MRGQSSEEEKIDKERERKNRNWRKAANEEEEKKYIKEKSRKDQEGQL